MNSSLLFRFGRVILVVAAYALVFLFYTYPLIQHWEEQVIGWDHAFADTPQIFSNLYLFTEGMENGNPFHTDKLFYPLGASTLMHGFIPGMGFLYYLSGGNVFFFINTFLLLSFVLGSLGAFRLAADYTTSFPGRLLVGFVYGFSCFHLAQLQDHYWYVINFTLPWYILHFRGIFNFPGKGKMVRIASRKSLVYCFLLGVVSASLDYYTTFFLIYFSLFYLLFRLVYPYLDFKWNNWKHLLILFGSVILLSSLIDTLKRAGLDDRHGLYWSGDVAGLIVPQNNLIYQELIPAGRISNRTAPSGPEKNLFMGYALLLAFILSIALHLRRPRDSRSANLLLATGLMLVLCFPVLKLFGHTLLKLPSALLHYLPFLNNIRVPTRWGILLYLFLPLFVVRVWEINLGRRARHWMSLVLLLLLLAEYRPAKYFRFPENNYTPLAKQIQSADADVLLTLPFGLRDGYVELGEVDTRFQYLQTLHGLSMPGGYLSRLDQSVFDFYRSDALCSELFALMDGETVPSNPSRYPEFFERFHPELLYVREDYREHEAFRHLVQASQIAGFRLLPISEGLYRFSRDEP